MDKQRRHDNLDGSAIHCSPALLEFIYGCEEPGELTPKQKERFQGIFKSAKPVGRVFIASTVEEIKGPNNEFIELWLKTVIWK